MTRAWRHQGRKIAIGTAIGLLLVAAVIAMGVSGSRVVGPGPFAREPAYEDNIPLHSGDVATWGFALPANPTGSEIVVLSVELVNPVGVEVLGVLAHHPATEGAVGQRYGFPPSGDLFAPAGIVLPPAGSTAAAVEALIGVRLTDKRSGSIDAVRIRYRQGGLEYADVLPYSLHVSSPTN